MQNQKNRFKVSTLFVLGAGASYAATQPKIRRVYDVPPQNQSPLDKDFTQILSSLESGQSEWVNTSVAEINRSWRDHIPFAKMGLEEAIITHSANMKFADAIHPNRSRRQIGFDEYLNHLVHLITFRLRKAREGNQYLYGRFVNRYFSQETKNRIITFNYDDVLDKYLLEEYGHEKVYSPVILSDQYEKPKKGVPKKWRSPLLIKLHGSVNWNCSSEEFLGILDQDTNKRGAGALSKIWYRETGCPRCDQDISPCIIPPIASKPVTRIKQFQYFWTTAYEYLHECENLVICGYSLPLMDALAASLFKGFSNKKLVSVTIIDPAPSIMEKWMTIFSRSNIGTPTWFYFRGFKEFVDSVNPL